MTRTVTIFRERGSKLTKIPDVSASTWEELQQILDENGIEYKNMNVIEEESQMTLNSLHAKLPPKDFILYIFPGKANSGTDGAPGDGTSPEDGRDTEEGQQEEFAPMTLERVLEGMDRNRNLFRRFISDNARALGRALCEKLEEVAEGMEQNRQDVICFEEYLRSPETYALRAKANEIASNLA